MTKYIILNPSVLYNVLNEKVLIYDTLTGKNIEITDTEISNLFLQNYILINENTNQNILDFIGILVENKLGDLIDGEYSPEPISLLTNLNVEESIQFYKSIVLAYPKYMYNTCYLYLNNKHSNLNDKFNIYNNQFPLLINNSNDKYIELDFDLIKEFLLHISEGDVINKKINLLGGDVFDYLQLTNLLELIDEHKLYTEINVTIDSFNKNIELVTKLLNNPHITFKLCVEFNKEKQKVKDLLELYYDYVLQINLSFIVTNSIDFDNANKFISSFKIKNSHVLFCYDKNNKDEIVKHYYITKEKLLNNNISSVQDVTMNRYVNNNDIGNYFITPDSNIYVNLNENPISTLNEILDVDINNLLMESSNKIGQVKYNSCSDCIYNFICPPITNLEYILNNNKLCNL